MVCPETKRSFVKFEFETKKKTACQMTRNNVKLREHNNLTSMV